MKKALILVGALSLLAACNEKKEEKATPAEAPVVAPLATVGKAVAYRCERDMPVTAFYGTDEAGKPDVALIVKGMDLRLTKQENHEGAEVYAAPLGLEEGKGLVWKVKGDNAEIRELPSSDVSQVAQSRLIRACSIKNQPDKNPVIR